MDLEKKGAPRIVGWLFAALVIFGAAGPVAADAIGDATAIAQEDRERMQENTRQAKLRRRYEAVYRREQRARLGNGKRGTMLRCSMVTIRQIRSLANARRQLALLDSSDVQFTGHRFSMAETLLIYVDRAYRRVIDQLEAVAEHEPRARIILDRTREIAAGG